jgi:hypothetical protein
MDRQESNPEHWESLAVADFDEGLLTRLGAAWDAPPEHGVEALLPPSRTGSRGPDPAALMAAAYPEPGPVVWKDPRASLLIPYWRAVLPGPLTAVLVWREPLAVARSLHRRDGIPLADGLALWEHYNRSAALGLQGIDTYVLDYASVVDDPRGALGRMCDWLSGFERFDPWAATWDADAAVQAIDEGLRHQTAGEDPDDGALPIDHRVVSDWLKSQGGGHVPLETLPAGPMTVWPEAVLAGRREQSAWSRKVRLAEIRREIDTLHHMLERERVLLDGEKRRYEGARRELERMRASTSWKVTRPLRSLMGKLSS